MKTTLFFLIIAITLGTSCKENNRSTSIEKKNISIRNLNDKEVLVDSINSFVKYKMEEMSIPGVSFAIINNGQMAFHSVLGHSDKERGNSVTKKTIFEAASTSKPCICFFDHVFGRRQKNGFKHSSLYLS